MKKILSVWILLFSFIPVFSQAITDEIITAIEAGNSKQLSGYFHETIELKMFEEVYLVSKPQAERILEKFFEENKPGAFIVNFNGSRQGSKYGLGSLITGKGFFRINMYFMEKKKEKTIYFLSIEKE